MGRVAASYGPCMPHLPMGRTGLALADHGVLTFTRNHVPVRQEQKTPAAGPASHHCPHCSQARPARHQRDPGQTTRLPDQVSEPQESATSTAKPADGGNGRQETEHKGRAPLRECHPSTAHSRLKGLVPDEVCKCRQQGHGSCWPRRSAELLGSAVSAVLFSK